ncbi:MAG TPA: hypothetical protein VFV83_06335 [Chthoniobacteraceae bacterium]|nr:hypothetical protein [Chthoniobacteraceae bacterium]
MGAGVRGVMPGNFRRRPLLMVALPLWVACAFLAGCAHEADPVAAAQKFFNLIAQNKTKEAYESSAFAFQTQQSLKAFEATVREQELALFASAKWEAPQPEGRLVKLRAEIGANGSDGDGGRKRALVVTMNHESGAWRTFSIRTPRSVQTGIAANLFGSVGKTASFVEGVDRPVPDDKTVRALALEELLRFNDALQKKSFADFYSEVSKTWQKQLTVGQLNRAFQPFIEHKVNIAGIEKVEPVFESPPIVTSEGLLVLTGYYPTDRYRVIFTLRFIYELPRWKLFGIDVTLKK